MEEKTVSWEIGRWRGRKKSWLHIYWTVNSDHHERNLESWSDGVRSPVNKQIEWHGLFALLIKKNAYLARLLWEPQWISSTKYIL